ncbi:glycoside hydrolase family 88 protein [Gelidibacter salicanalis]|uniref:Glycoside hydrolase family 88 protein n=1 Tax=Gelidibacter salicanalis TaxID=291193 RepID=A0A934KSW4_9FLAO|nr:glycoside hydrolase family 88 protein [Gelidibacter salicanalis]MBJ7882984.1 glycoside hydrolase family 88 protein [Gelidibacter salicanalis]
MKLFKIIMLLQVFTLFYTCSPARLKNKENFTEQQLSNANKQISLLLNAAMEANRIPRTIDENGNLQFTNLGFDWTEGFFPGTCWYLYGVTKDEKWKLAAEKFQAQYENHKYRTISHDLGFIFNNSYGNGYKLTKNEDFKKVLTTAGDSLITRFNPIVGSLLSWNVDNGWQSKRGWKFPVIIDNMMNLEMLFELSELTGDDKYKKVAIAHANTTLKNHFREDNSSYHVVDYDPETGDVRSKQTAQGFSDESAWARGQAWGVYGYTMCYRFTKDEKYLEQAQKIADYIIHYKGTPEDGIPYWDYNDAKIPNSHRDASAAAITVSALIELNDYTNGKYETAVDKILGSLASKEYTAKLGENKNFILKHSVGSIPHNNEIDVPLNYADYYYLEALIRYKKYTSK